MSKSHCGHWGRITRGPWIRLHTRLESLMIFTTSSTICGWRTLLLENYLDKRTPWRHPGRPRQCPTGRVWKSLKIWLWVTSPTSLTWGNLQKKEKKTVERVTLQCHVTLFKVFFKASLNLFSFLQILIPNSLFPGITLRMVWMVLIVLETSKLIDSHKISI